MNLDADVWNLRDQDLVVNRWKRYGKDRLYVTTADETKVGFWDLVTGEAHPETPEDQPALLAAAQGWKDTQDADGIDVPSPVAVAAPAAEERVQAVPMSLPTVAPIPETLARAGTDPVLSDAAPVRPVDGIRPTEPRLKRGFSGRPWCVGAVQPAR